MARSTLLALLLVGCVGCAAKSSRYLMANEVTDVRVGRGDLTAGRALAKDGTTQYIIYESSSCAGEELQVGWKDKWGSSSEKCKAVCSADEACTAFTFYLTSLRCQTYSGCTKDNLASNAGAETGVKGDTVPATVVDLAASNPDFELLVQAIEAAGVRETLSKKGPFTVFAPSNEAIAKLIAEMGTSAEELLKDTEMLKKVVNHHVIKGSLVLSSDLIDGQEVEMLSGYSVTVSINDYGVMIDNATVVMLDLMAGNGVAHVIDTVLMPPLPVPVEAKAPALRVFNDKKKGMTCTAKPLEETSKSNEEKCQAACEANPVCMAFTVTVEAKCNLFKNCDKTKAEAGAITVRVAKKIYSLKRNMSCTGTELEIKGVEKWGSNEELCGQVCDLYEMACKAFTVNLRNGKCSLYSDCGNMVKADKSVAGIYMGRKYEKYKGAMCSGDELPLRGGDKWGGNEAKCRNLCSDRPDECFGFTFDLSNIKCTLLSSCTKLIIDPRYNSETVNKVATKVEKVPTKVEKVPTKVEKVPTKVDAVPTKVDKTPAPSLPEFLFPAESPSQPIWDPSTFGSDYGCLKDDKSVLRPLGTRPRGVPKCICDGAFSGIRIAKNVCVDIKAECGIPVDATGKFAVIDRICDGFETASCLAAASSEDGMDDMCKDIITNGFGDCTAADMRLKFEAAVRPVCEPICPDCPKVDA